MQSPSATVVADELLAFLGERVVDTLVLARRKHPGGHNTLDDLCAHYRIDRSRHTQHGALLDAELLAAVYVELTTTRQAALQLEPLAVAPSTFRQSSECGPGHCCRA